MGANPGLCGEKPATNRLSYVTTFETGLLGLDFIKEKKKVVHVTCIPEEDSFFWIPSFTPCYL
jgi:hypothetical protein